MMAIWGGARGEVSDSVQGLQKGRPYFLTMEYGSCMTAGFRSQTPYGESITPELRTDMV
jgi:hypothetical protein